MMPERPLYQLELNESQMKLRTTFEGLEEAAQIRVRVWLPGNDHQKHENESRPLPSQLEVWGPA